MRTGFVFDWMEAAFELEYHQNPDIDAEKFIVEDSGKLEKLAEQLNVEYLSLNWKYSAFVLKEKTKPVVKSYEKSLIPENKDRILDKLREGLEANGLTVGEAVCLEDPEWTRHGVPINYENWTPDFEEV